MGVCTDMANKGSQLTKRDRYFKVTKAKIFTALLQWKNRPWKYKGNFCLKSLCEIFKVKGKAKQ